MGGVFVIAQRKRVPKKKKKKKKKPNKQKTNKKQNKTNNNQKTKTKTSKKQKQNKTKIPKNKDTVVGEHIVTKIRHKEQTGQHEELVLCARENLAKIRGENRQ